MPHPKISVIIPVYNSEKYLNRCLDSIINQTEKDIEILLMVYDGSTDNSCAICDDFQSLDKRVNSIHQSIRGIGFARSAGLKIATGEFISFVDSDDYIKTDMYEKLYSYIKRDDSDTCIFCHQKIREGKILYTKLNAINGTFKGQAVLENIFLDALGTEPSYPDDFRILWQSPWSSLYSMDLIKKYNIDFPSQGDFVSFGEDILFNMDYFYHAYNVKIINEPFYCYCENQNSSQTTYREDRFINNVNLYNEQLSRIKNYIKNKDLLERAVERMQRTFLASARYCIMQIAEFFTYNKARSLISDICNNYILQDVLNSYPWKKNPIKYRIFNYFLTKKGLFILYFLGKFKK